MLIYQKSFSSVDTSMKKCYGLLTIRATFWLNIKSVSNTGMVLFVFFPNDLSEWGFRENVKEIITYKVLAGRSSTCPGDVLNLVT